jgi:hypothetical protein
MPRILAEENGGVNEGKRNGNPIARTSLSYCPAAAPKKDHRNDPFFAETVRKEAT